MGKVTNFEKRFLEHYNSQPFKEYLLLEKFYMLGVRDAAQDAIDTLDDYATALSGTGQEHAYDRASANLHKYFTEEVGLNDIY